MLLRAGHVATAEQLFSEHFETTADPRLALGWPITLHLQGKHEAANTRYRQVLERLPEYGDGWASLADCLKNQGRFDEAKTACQRALPLNHGSAMAWSNLGDAREGLGEPEDARRCWLKALELRPDLDDARAALARLGAA